MSQSPISKSITTLFFFTEYLHSQVKINKIVNTKKVIKKQAGSGWNFYHHLIQVYRGVSIFYFRINYHFIIFRRISPLPGQDQQNDNIVLQDYCNIRIHLLIFVKISQFYFRLEYFLNFLSTSQITRKCICESTNWI